MKCSAHCLGVFLCLVLQQPGAKRRKLTVTTSVKPGDSLWAISRQLTGNGANWKGTVRRLQLRFICNGSLLRQGPQPVECVLFGKTVSYRTRHTCPCHW